MAAKVDQRVTEMARTASMPGFRPGKVPAGLLKKQYGQALLAEARQRAQADGISVELHAGDAQALPFADGSFDTSRSDTVRPSN